MNGGLRGWVNEDTGEHAGHWTLGSNVCVCVCVLKSRVRRDKN